MEEFLLIPLARFRPWPISQLIRPGHQLLMEVFVWLLSTTACAQSSCIYSIQSMLSSACLPILQLLAYIWHLM